MIERKRVNIMPLAKQFRDQGYAPQANDVSLVGDFSLEWIRTKPELYALTSVISDRIVRNAYNARSEHSPFGLITSIGNPTVGFGHADAAKLNIPYKDVAMADLNSEAPFISVSNFMRETLFTSIMDELRAIRSGQESQETFSVWQRLQTLVSRLSNLDNAPQGRYNSSVAIFIASGVNFAALVMAGVTEIVPRISDEKDPNRLVEILRNSYPLIIKLAAGNFEVVQPLVEQILAHNLPGNHLRFIDEHFSIKGVGENSRLDFSHETQESLEEADLHLDGLGLAHSQTIGCPAVVNFGDRSAIRLLWDWHMEIAEKIYPTLIPAPKA